MSWNGQPYQPAEETSTGHYAVNLLEDVATMLDRNTDFCYEPVDIAKFADEGRTAERPRWTDLCEDAFLANDGTDAPDANLPDDQFRKIDEAIYTATRGQQKLLREAAYLHNDGRHKILGSLFGCGAHHRVFATARRGRRGIWTSHRMGLLPAQPPAEFSQEAVRRTTR